MLVLAITVVVVLAVYLWPTNDDEFDSRWSKPEQLDWSERSANFNMGMASREEADGSTTIVALYSPKQNLLVRL